MVLCLHLGFPTKNLQADVRIRDVVASVILTFAAAKKAYEDITGGLVFFLEAWAYCVVTLVVARVVFFPGCPIRVIMDESCKTMESCPCCADSVKKFCDGICVYLCALVTWGSALLLGCIAIAFGSFATFCLCNLLPH
eukprot:TRINITY_DN8475_c0_g1_i3.p1 TRINITY_DN8475_c0_g1~~TRINITY_DN8475_c0_g1_i3.p1  ORF type:complete len:138 (+),score=16.61 TRINITY_DN8475_c0_g1_i3:177-590(+)